MRISWYRIPEVLGDAILVAAAFTMASFLRFDFARQHISDNRHRIV